ncbi:MAG TPA: hypothetical protein VHQ65_15905 [Thermoanaerobaculia bacterium]|nr:hypothetical protein [Thermoanaerobaculia bacterium]
MRRTLCFPAVPSLLLSLSVLAVTLAAGPATASHRSDHGAGSTFGPHVGNGRFALYEVQTATERCLWRTDGTAAGTFLLQAPAAACLTLPHRVSAVGAEGVLFFPAFDGSSVEIWRSDGSPAGTWPVTALGAAGAMLFPFSIDPLADGGVFFSAFDDVHGEEPWRGDGSPAGAAVLGDFAPGLQSSRPFGGRTWQGDLWFFAAAGEDAAVPWQLWRGAPGGGAASVATVAGAGGATAASALLETGDVLSFLVADRACTVAELWATDGTAAGTGAVASFAPGCPRWLVLVDGTLFFTAAEAGRGMELWSSDGTAAGTRRRSDFAPPAPISAGARAGVLGDAVVVAADGGAAAGVEPWIAHGAVGDAAPLGDLCPGACSSAPEAFARAGGRLFFLADDGSHGRELWSTDGTAAGTGLVADLCPGACSGVVDSLLVVLGEGVLFPADDGSGQQVWASDGDTVRALTALPAIDGASPLGGQYAWRVVGGRMTFTADDGSHGLELWVTDGTPQGTRLLRNLTGDPAAPGEPPPAPSGLAVTRDRDLIELRWRGDGVVERYVVELRPAGGAWTALGEASGHAEGLFRASLRELPPADSYDWRVRAENAAGSSPPSAAVTLSLDGTCVPTDDALCFHGGRFRVSVTWSDHRNGGSGTGHALPSEGRSGAFWFFRPDNVELIVKVLDGRPVNGRFWFFYGALSDVQYVLSVEDTVTGESGNYVNRAGHICGYGDTAFPPAGGEVIRGSSFSLAPGALQGFASPAAAVAAPATAAPDASHPSHGCVEDAGALCLLGGRFRVEVDWQDHHNGGTGTGGAVPFADRSGFFWFFRPDNLELVVKVLDGTPVNGKVWVFWGALTDVGYTLRVTDTLDGHQQRQYVNQPGNLCGGADTGAF